MRNAELYEAGAVFVSASLRHRLKKAFAQYLKEFGIDEKSEDHLFFSLAMYSASRDVMAEFEGELTDMLRSLGESGGNLAEFAGKVSDVYDTYVKKSTDE